MVDFRYVILLVIAFIIYCCSLPAGAALSAAQKTVSVNGRSFTVKVVRAPLSEYRVKVGLAHGKVGGTQALAGIAGAGGAEAAINGCFFDAYVKDAIKPPNHNLITGGELVHLGDTGTTLGFDSEGNYRMEAVKYRLQGKVAGKSWYAYFMNHPAKMSSAAIIYTKRWAGARPPVSGKQVVVRDGKVASVNANGSLLPDSGYSLLFSGGDAYMAGRFQTGEKCSFELSVKKGDADFWANASEALGCGPRLVKDGKISVNPAAEGFSSPKILSMACQRSAVGLTAGGEILLVTCPSATIGQLAAVMRSLGARDAMNLDGGASSSLWAQGKYLTKPGRDISNALLLVRK